MSGGLFVVLAAIENCPYAHCFIRGLQTGGILLLSFRLRLVSGLHLEKSFP